MLELQNALIGNLAKLMKLREYAKEKQPETNRVSVDKCSKKMVWIHSLSHNTWLHIEFQQHVRNA